MSPSAHAPIEPPMGARTQVGVSIAVGVVAAVPIALVTSSWTLLPLFAWDAASLVYLGWVWTAIARLDADHTARRSIEEDPTRVTADLLILSAAVASLVAVAFVLAQATNSQGSAATLLAALGVASVVLSWGMVHTVYTLRYARLFYGGSRGGIDFNQDQSPRYADFAYLSFTLGMTFQVSDTDLKTTEIRSTALRHALLSYVFGTVILATSINLIANAK